MAQILEIDLEDDPENLGIHTIYNRYAMPMPEEWKCVVGEDGEQWFYNVETGESRTVNPLDEYFK